MKTFLLFASLILATVLPSSAAPFWRCELPGGIYMVSLPTVTSVSTHEYVVNPGTARVTELTIGTNGAVVARFYYIEPLAPKSPIGLGQSIIDKVQEKVEEAADRADVEQVWKKVVKDYPLSTHAHTVEFRLDTLEKLTKLEKSVEDAWRFNKDVSIKIE